MAKRNILQLLYDQFQSVPPLEPADVSQKTVCVLGANAGIGFEAAKHFARMDAGRIIMACRSVERGQAALKALAKDTGYMRAELWIVDLGNFASVNAFGEKFKLDDGRLDILIANAAIPVSEDKIVLTSDGWEPVLQTNHLSIALAVLLLVPILVRSSRIHGSNSRLVVVSSEVHVFPQLHRQVTRQDSILSALNQDANYIKSERYFVSKLFNILFTRAFNQHISSTSIIPVVINPGACISSIRDSIPPYTLRWLNAKFQELVAYSAEDGGRQLVAAATRGLGVDNEENLLRGAFIKLKPVEVSDYIMSDEGQLVQERVWNETIDVLGKVNPKVFQVAKEFFSA